MKYIFLVLLLTMANFSHAETTAGDEGSSGPNVNQGNIPSQAQNISNLGACVAKQLLKPNNTTDPRETCHATEAIVTAVKQLPKAEQQKLAVLQIFGPTRDHCHEFLRLCEGGHLNPNQECHGTYTKCMLSTN